MVSPVPNQQHFLLIPLMCQSHLIPFTGIAKLLAKQGMKVTILMTPVNAIRYNNVPDDSIASNLDIQFITLKFPCKEAGLPEGCENLDSLPSPELVPRFFVASNMLQTSLEEFLDNMEAKSRPNCIIADLCLPWTQNIATKLKIPRMVFHSISCFSLLCSRQIGDHVDLENCEFDSKPIVVPNIPDEIKITKAQLPEILFTRKGRAQIDHFKAGEMSADGVIVNSFEELEPNYVRGYQNFVKKLWCVGPVFLSKKLTSPKVETGLESSLDGSHCLKWLDSKESSSVLYVCFGSLCHISTSQLIELAMGLEESSCSFIWVIRRGNYSLELDKWFLEHKFEERIKGRGLIIQGWAPQVLILSHPAIAGFMTHCGWNSTLEGVSTGVPMITWPMSAEQFLNEKFIVQVLHIGVAVGADKRSDSGEDKNAIVFVKRDDIKEAIEKLIDESDEGSERRKKAKELGGIARRAVEEGGSSYADVSQIIDFVAKTNNS